MPGLLASVLRALAFDDESRESSDDDVGAWRMAADVARDSDEVTDDESSSSSDEDDEDPAGTRRVARQKMASAKKVVARRAARLRKEEFEKEKSSCRLLAVCRGDSAWFQPQPAVWKPTIGIGRPIEYYLLFIYFWRPGTG
jgi:hypothetical protein